MHLAKCKKKEQRPRPICWFNGFAFFFSFFFSLKIDLENWVLGFQVLKSLIYFISFFFSYFSQQPNDALLSACGRWKYSIKLREQTKM